MIKSPMQLKAKIGNISDNSKKSQALQRTFFMERFLERLSKSKYRDSFVLKGGLLVSALIGQNLRSTTDIDTTIRNLPLNSIQTEKIIKDIISVKLEDNVTFKIKSQEEIMEDFEYPGLRFKIEASLEKTRDMIKIDISTNDVITPRPIVTDYKLTLENRSISIYTYNLETVLAEKLQTVLARSVDNTRLKDFYDIHMIIGQKSDQIDIANLREAFERTTNKRNTPINIQEFSETVERLKCSLKMNNLWENYKNQSFYVGDISWSEVMESASQLCSLAITQWGQYHLKDDESHINASDELRAYMEKKALRAVNQPKTLSQKIEDAKKAACEKNAARSPHIKPMDHTQRRK